MRALSITRRSAGVRLAAGERRAAVAVAALATLGLSAREASAQPAAAPELIEVTVEGEKAPPGSTSLGRRNIREIPGVLDDPYRAIEVQPGVTPAASGIPYYFIRGAPPGNVGYFFDGVQVPLLFHVGGGPSVIPAAMIRRVEFHPGPYPASVGRFAGAVVDAESTPPAYAWRGEGSVRVTDVGGFIEGPLRDDVSALVGGRYSAGASLVGALVPFVDLGYGDYQARVTWTPTPQDRLSVFAFGAYDYLATFSPCEVKTEDDQRKDVLLNSDFHRVELRYERDSATLGKVASAVTFGFDRSRDVGVALARDVKVAARMSVSRPVLAGRALVRGGLDMGLDRYDITPQAATLPEHCPKDPPTAALGSFIPGLESAFKELFPSRYDLAMGVWADAIIKLGERATVTPAIRIDHYASVGNTAIAIDPKLVGRFGVGEHLRLVPAVGIASQLPGFAPLPALQIGGIPGGLQRSLQTSFGAEVTAGPIEAVATVFRQATFNLTDPIGIGRGTTFGPERFLSRSLGDAYGLELGARGALRRNIFFLASYTLSRATRSQGGLTVPSAYDRTHLVNLALLYDLGNNVRAGVRHVFYTGFPADEASEGRPASVNPARVKPFYRLDVRVAKRWKVGARGYIGAVLDLQNATLSKEVFDVSCSDKGCTPRTIGPLTIPSLAVEAGF